MRRQRRIPRHLDHVSSPGSSAARLRAPTKETARQSAAASRTASLGSSENPMKELRPEVSLRWAKAP
eukprot:scaffold24515_cov112-Isochrysis_galbana.AAC.3